MISGNRSEISHFFVGGYTASYAAMIYPQVKAVVSIENMFLTAWYIIFNESSNTLIESETSGGNRSLAMNRRARTTTKITFL